MSDLKVITNGARRPLLTWWDLTRKEQAEFDYRTTETEQADGEFVRYRGWTYDLAEFMRTAIDGWDGISADTYFSATLCRYVDDNQFVVMGRCYS